MADMMTFPNTWEEFEQFYGITDTEEIYTNGARLIPSFRVKQWLDHAQPEQRWIPCSERLPEYRKLVDVTTRDLRVKLAYLDSIEEDGTDDWWIIPLEDAECALWNVVAWMPLPEPYRGES